MTQAWGGRRITEVARPFIAAKLPAPCGQCGRTVEKTDTFVVGHVIARSIRPDLTWVPSNWCAEHKGCSDKSSQSVVIAKAKAEALAEAASSAAIDAGQAPNLPFSPSGDPDAPFSIPDALTWNSFVQRAPDWLLPWLEMDANSNPPLAISPLHPDAVGTYADVAVPWIENVEGKTLRWWQKLGLALKLQHDAEGRLLKRIVVETGPRRAGKSVGLRGLALWRMEHGHKIFGERQEIIHTGSDMAVCRKAQKEAWRWSEAQWGAKSVTRGNGKEAIERPDDGSVWYVRAQDATYGWDTTLGLVDEGWDVKPDTVTEGIEPSLMGRQSPQLVMTSTAHRRARSTMRTALTTALEGEDARTLLLWWGAPPGADPSDPEVWKAASPYWDEERAEFVASMYAKALAGEQDPELDDVDPMKGFECQYTNRWDLRARRQVGEALVDRPTWRSLEADVPDVAPTGVAVESWPGSAVSCAAAWRLEDGRTVVSVTEHADVAEAAAMAKAWACRTPVRVGASLVKDPAWRGIRFVSMSATIGGAVTDVVRWLADGVLAHDGGDYLADQMTTVRTRKTPTGQSIVSAGPSDAVKAAAWAVAVARQRRSGSSKMILPRAS